MKCYECLYFRYGKCERMDEYLSEAVIESDDYCEVGEIVYLGSDDPEN